MVTYALLSAIFYAFDTFHLFQQYKVQANRPYDPAKITQAIKRVAVNLIPVQFAVNFFVAKLLVWRGCDHSEELPGLDEVGFFKFCFEI